MVNPGPAGLWVTTDEHPDGINDGGFAISMTQTSWVDCPAPYHNTSTDFSFADGHAEIHKWARPSALAPVTYTGPLGSGGSWGGNTANNPDVIWAQARTTAKP